MKYGRADRLNFRHPGEARALNFLEEQGHLLLRHNYHTRFAEIDLITAVPEDDFRLHAIEVKAWSTDSASKAPFVHPLHSFNARKQAKMRRAIESFRIHAARTVAFDILNVSDITDPRNEQGKAAAPGSSRQKNNPIDEPAWILSRAGCPVDIMQLDVSFDLVWVNPTAPAGHDCEYFPDLF